MAGKPGRSGRKRQGAEPKVYFNSRLDPQLRDQLEAAAEERGRSLSSEIEERLRNSLVPAGKMDDSTRALCLLIVEAAKQTSVGGRNWTNDNSLCYAFMRAVSLIISMVRASGRGRRTSAAEAPFSHPIFQSPEDLARATALRIGDELVAGTSETHERAFRALGSPEKWLRHMRISWARRGDELGAERLFADYDADKLRELLREIETWSVGDTHMSPEGALLHRLSQLVAEKTGGKL